MVLSKKKTKKKKIDSLFALQICLLIIIFATFIPCILNAGKMILVEDESRVWGFAYSIMGVDWSVYMRESSLISFGYSVLLAPICAILKSPVAIYKMVVLGNAVALCISYLLSIYVFNRVFPDKNKKLITLACGAVALCPGYAQIKSLAVPDMLILLIFWISVVFLVELHQNPSLRKLLGFGITIGIGVMFHAAMVCIVVAGVIVVIKLVQDKKVVATQALWGGVCVIILFVIIQGIESFWLAHIFKDTDLRITTSLGTLFDGMAKGWDNTGLLGLLDGFFGKLYSLAVGTMLTSFLGIWAIYINRKKITGIILYMLISCILLLFGLSMFYSTVTTGDSVLNARMLFVVASPILIIGILEMIENKKWLIMLISCIGITVSLTFIVSESLKTYSSSNLGYHNMGLLFKELDNISESIEGKVYFIIVLVMSTLLIITVLIRNTIKNKFWMKLFNYSGILLAFVFLITLSGVIEKTDIMRDEKSNSDAARVASLITEQYESAPIYYFASGSNQAGNSAKMQYLLGDKQMYLMDENEFEELEKYEGLMLNNKPYFLITSSDNNIEKYNKKYVISDLTNKYALLTKRGSIEATQLEAMTSERIYDMSFESVDEHNDLAPGTYEVSVSLKTYNVQEKGLAKISIVSGNTELKSVMIDSGIIQDGNATVGLTFASGEILKDISIIIDNQNGADFVIEKCIYRRSSNRLTLGIEAPEQFEKVCKIINDLDKVSGNSGSIGVISDNLTSFDAISLDYAKKQLSENKLMLIPKGKKVQNDYLISNAEDRSYYDYLEEYTILVMNDKYVLLGENQSSVIESMNIIGKKPLSEGKKLVVQHLFKKKNGGYDYESPITVMSGNYNYIIKLSMREKILSNGNIGKIGVYSSDNLLAEVEISQSMFDVNGDALIEIPLAVRNKIRNLKCKIDSEQSIDFMPLYLEMTSDKFQVGSDNQEGMQKIIEIIQKIGKESPIYHITSRSVRNKGMFSISNLQKSLSGYNIINSTLNEVKDYKTDCFLIVENFGAGSMELAQNYSMIAQEGTYSLWVADYGKLQSLAVEKGYGMITSGSKIPISALNSQDKEYSSIKGDIGALYKGNYLINIEVHAKKLYEEDSAVIQLLSIQDQEEAIDDYINHEIEKGTMIIQDLTDRAVRKIVGEIVEIEKVVSSVTVTSDKFINGNSAIVEMNVNLEKSIKCLELRVLSYKGNELTAQPLWIEKE